MALSFWLGLAALGLAVAAASALAAASLVARHERDAAEVLGARIGRHGLWVGAWLVGIPSRKKAEVVQAACRVAERGESPDQIVAIWRSARARVMTHLPGPEVASAEDACAWLRRTADELAEPSAAGFSLPRDEAPFAMLYARSAPPLPRSQRIDDVARAVLGDQCLGAAFIACAASRARRPVSFALYGVACGFVTASIAALAVGPSAFPPPKQVPAPKDAPAPGAVSACPPGKASSDEPTPVLPSVVPQVPSSSPPPRPPASSNHKPPKSSG